MDMTTGGKHVNVIYFLQPKYMYVQLYDPLLT